MNSDQRKVAIGAASGVMGMIMLVALLFWILPVPTGMDETLARVIFTIWMNVLAVIPLFVGIAMVGNNRFMSEAIDPLRHAEVRATVINSRFVDNTLEQNSFFL